MPRRIVYASIIVLALICGLPVVLALGEAGNSGVTVTVSATPEIARPRRYYIARYYIDTNLFGVEKSYRISRTGEILKTIEATSADGNLTITIPKDTVALDKDGKRLKSLEAAVNESPPDPPKDAYIIELAYDFGPAGATFDPAITFPWSYDLPEDVAEEDLFIAYYDEEAGEWVELDGEVDTENDTITTSVECFTFTTFAIIGRVPPAPPAPAAFTFSSLGISPSQVAPGEEVTISVLVANTGGELGSYSVVLKINGVKEQEKLVTITAGRSRSVSFTVSREDSGNYTVQVDGLSGSFTVAPVVIPPAPAAFSVSSLAVEPAGVKPGESVAVSIVVANSGGESGNYTVVLKINGVKEAEERITVAAGSTETVAFSVTREDPGNYTVDVDGLSGRFTVLVLVKPAGVNWPLVGGIIGGVIVVGLLIYFLVFRRSIFFLGVAIREIRKEVVRRLIRLLTFLEIIPLKLCKQWRWLQEKFGKI